MPPYWQKAPWDPPKTDEKKRDTHRRQLVELWNFSKDPECELSLPKSQERRRSNPGKKFSQPVRPILKSAQQGNRPQVVSPVHGIPAFSRGFCEFFDETTHICSLLDGRGHPHWAFSLLFRFWPPVSRSHGEFMPKKYPRNPENRRVKPTWKAQHGCGIGHQTKEHVYEI